MQKEYNLLLKDLSARLPYGVKVRYSSTKEFITCKLHSTYPIYKIVDLWSEKACFNSVHISKIKPYLFPLSSMTEEQKIECFKGTPLEIDKYGNIAVKDDLYGGSLYTDLEIYLEVIDWLLKNHFDIYGLIPMELANDATDKNIY